ncbi:hypothetical protein L208DRAFT_1420467 [Tricholoma matsutake]|nr:hypothetical protein L208DRAFT_1420467 [Tricholoma matsutake 945]
MASILSCRLPYLPNHLCLLVHRLASTTTSSHSKANNLYLYPTHSRPTPHQIFHLPPGASQDDIKARYYDLVRIHHPDSVHSRLLSPSVRHARFQSITSAYDILRGKSQNSPHSGVDPYSSEVHRRKHFYQAHHDRRAEYAYPGREWTASPDDRWKDRVIIIVGLVTLAAGVIPGVFLLPSRFEQRHRSAVSNLSQARYEARELGEERRNGVRKRVKDIKTQQLDEQERAGEGSTLKEREDET